MKSSGLERVYTHSNLKFAEMRHIDLIGLTHPGALLRKGYTGFLFFRIFFKWNQYRTLVDHWKFRFLEFSKWTRYLLVLILDVNLQSLREPIFLP